MFRLLICTFCVLIATSNPVVATPGDPVAVRWWGQNMVSIETYWDLHIVVDPHRAKIGYADPQIPADLVLVSHDHFDVNNVEIVGGQPAIVQGVDDQGTVAQQHGVLDRPPNTPRPTWQGGRAIEAATSHAVRVSVVAGWHDEQQGADQGATALFVIDVDGVRIVHCGDLGQKQLSPEQVDALGAVDVLLLPIGGTYTLDGQKAARVVEQVGPRMVIPLSYKTPALNIELDGPQPFLEALGGKVEVRRPPGNTVAVESSSSERQRTGDGEDEATPDEATQDEAAQPETTTPAVVLLGYQPWQPEGELAELFEQKEAACQASQRVFETLSTEQMNFRPSDGTHTPRWNAEHMMGRELLFFTQAYAARDPAFRPIDLNPAQMPPDYRAAHPDWTGAEEARQMERVCALVRRFAYLLDEAELDEPAWPEGWTLRFLLNRMKEHYQQHTANVQKKFELPDWPDSHNP